MMDIETIYNRIQKNKKERSEAAKMIRDELANNAKYQALAEEAKRIRDEMATIKNEVRSFAASEAEKLDDLAKDIKIDNQLLVDATISKFVAGETVEIVDENNQKWVPTFSVRFAKDR